MVLYGLLPLRFTKLRIYIHSGRFFFKGCCSYYCSCFLRCKRFSENTTGVVSMDMVLVTVSVDASLTAWCRCSIRHVHCAWKHTAETIIGSPIFFDILPCQSTRSSNRRNLKEKIHYEQEVKSSKKKKKKTQANDLHLSGFFKYLYNTVNIALNQQLLQLF